MGLLTAPQVIGPKLCINDDNEWTASSCKADKFASEEEIIGSANYRVIGTHPLQLCLVAKGSTNNYSIVLHMSNPVRSSFR